MDKQTLSASPVWSQMEEHIELTKTLAYLGYFLDSPSVTMFPYLSSHTIVITWSESCSSHCVCSLFCRISVNSIVVCKFILGVFETLLTWLRWLCWVVVNQLTAECVARGSCAVSVISKGLIQQYGVEWKEEILVVLDTQGGSHLDGSNFRTAEFHTFLSSNPNWLFRTEETVLITYNTGFSFKYSAFGSVCGLKAMHCQRFPFSCHAPEKKKSGFTETGKKKCDGSRCVQEEKRRLGGRLCVCWCFCVWSWIMQVSHLWLVKFTLS